MSKTITQIEAPDQQNKVCTGCMYNNGEDDPRCYCPKIPYCAIRKDNSLIHMIYVEIV